MTFAEAAYTQEVLRTTKQQGLNDDNVESALESIGNQHAIEIEALRKSEGRLTYDDLPRLSELILQNQHVADLYRSHFAAVIVDEFQDLTPQQLRIVNSIGFGKTTYAGDLAQGIYSFAGSDPVFVYERIQEECQGNRIELAESHRSSPAVLGLVNSLAPMTKGLALTSADPLAWPGGGLAAVFGCESTDREAAWATSFARYTLERSPSQRIAIIARLKSRRRFVDAAFSETELPVHRWDSAVLDTQTAKIVKSLLARIDPVSFAKADDPIETLRREAGFENVQDPADRESLAEALAWCCDLLLEGETPSQIRSKVSVGDKDALLEAPGVHLLTGHIGKGQQFDWVFVVGAEEGCIPDFRASTEEQILEEARILSVMISRARHGAIVTHSAKVAAQNGTIYSKQGSRFLDLLASASPCDGDATVNWMKTTPWDHASG
ncbi:UvrD-helicase domain-containing protein [Pseudonocardia kujensis]|uniref:3'-5' exonuclease n=1 Tax=Pseudonocardia kujensis TaxID=1128675 RepID=UPI001E5439A3|nr:3'-5' exonuclease [Pseudonocardia kujensis]MCE0765812.1 UvrD-helicase domain-containing protein [Pseudonocardia kujensis]